MKWLFTFRTGVESITTHRMRSILTALGILFGVAAVIATVGVGQASAASVTSRINALGTNLLTVSPGSSSSSGVRGGFGSASTLTINDTNALANKQDAPDIGAVAPVVQRSESMQLGSSTWTTTVVGSNQDWLSANARSLSQGSFFDSNAVRLHTHDVILGATTLSELGAQVGDVITIADVPFTVSGVLTSSGSSGFTNSDDTAVIPLTAYTDNFGGNSLFVQRILVSAASSDVLGSAYTEAYDLLLQSHHIVTPSLADFSIGSATTILSTAQSVTSTLTILLASVAAISLLVGGIGVMNIMLVSVTERYSEIGLRKALGATRRDIRRQFLIEASALSFVGGVLGVAVGVLASIVIPKVTGIAVAISLPAIFVSVVVAAFVGLIFGVYPAARAARLAPIDALRSQ